MNRINEISFNASLLRELRAVGFVHKMLEEGWIKDEFRDRLRYVRIHSIRSDLALVDLSVASKFNVDRAFLSELKERGRSIADRWLAENRAHVGVRSTAPIRDMYDGSN